MRSSIYLSLVLLAIGALSSAAWAVEISDFSKESPELQLQKVRQQNSELQLQLDRVQQELMGLRGEVENLQHQFKQLKLEQEKEKPAAAEDNMAAGAGDEANSNQPSIDPADLASYNAAFNYLKQKKYTLAEEKFKSYLATYPKGQYVANANYWLGELYLLSDKASLARSFFQKVIDKFPTDSKADDARFKMAQLYHRANEHEKAKALLQNIMQSKTSGQRVKNMAQKFWDETYSK